MIDASPFVTLATNGPDGLDCSPRGDAGSVVRVTDEKTVMVADRRGNNLIDSLRNIMHDPHVALLFLISGSGNTMRIQGRAEISVEPELLSAHAIEGKGPRGIACQSLDRRQARQPQITAQCRYNARANQRWPRRRCRLRQDLASPR